MIKKIKLSIHLVYINIIIFFLLIFTIKVNSETKIIAKEGDTLIKISERYGVPLKELMYKNDYNNATKIIEGEIIIIPHKDIQANINNKHPTHKVIQGDTLYKIAKDYNINLKDIISINNLSNDYYLQINQIILLPKGATKYKK